MAGDAAGCRVEAKSTAGPVGPLRANFAHRHMHTWAHTHSGQAGEALPGQKEAGPLPVAPANQQMAQQPGRVQALASLESTPASPSWEKMPWDLVIHSQKPPMGRAQAAIPRGDTQPSLTPDSPCQPPVTLARAGQLELTNRSQDRTSSNSCNTHGGKHEGFERNSTRRVTMAGTLVSQRTCPPPGSPEIFVFKVDLMRPGSRRRHRCA